jgi:hypothetical protein
VRNAAVVADQRFERPTDFDLASYWAESTAAFERDVERVEVTLRMDPSKMDLLREVCGDAAVRAAEQVTPPDADPDGWQVLRLRLDWPEEVPSRLLGLGVAGEVLEPATLRERVSHLARQVAARYAVTSLY